MAEVPVGTLIAVIGFGLGIVFGATVQRTNFCTMGAISDIVFIGDWNRFRAWMLAIAVAMLGSQAMHLAGSVDLNQSIYLTTNLGWLGAIVGGLLFGFGMTMTGGCGSKMLARIGAGNLKSLVAAIFLGILAYTTLRGLTGMARVEIEGWTNADLGQAGLEAQGIPDILALWSGLPIDGARGIVALAAIIGLLWFCFKSTDFRNSRVDIASGLILGIVIVAGWYATGVIGFDDFEPTPLASLTFVAPVGDSIQYLMTFSGATINFGIAAVGGVIVGSFLTAKATGQFRMETFSDANDMVRHMVGGSVMGIGGIMALGCTIGQGMTGISTLAFGSLLALLSIIAGAVFGMKYLEEGSFSGALSALLARD